VRGPLPSAAGGGLSSRLPSVPTTDSRISLYVDIGQGAGLAGATGVRPFLPPLLAGALARGDMGIDFDGSAYSFLESPAFLLVVFGLAVIAYAIERSGRGGAAVARAFAVVALLLGALLFAGSLDAGGHDAIPGIVAGMACSLLAYMAVNGLLDRARGRLDDSAAGLLTVYADVAALVLAAIAVFAPPVSFLAIAAFVVLLIRGRGQADRKYAGLRILR
jgi:membrane-bound metal-dependent hydrolase YbcI (DUF457 family)